MKTRNRWFGIGLLLSLLAVLAPPIANADPTEDCDFVPLRYTKNYSAAGRAFTTTANLRVYDLCDAGTIVGTVGIRPRNGTTFGRLSPIQPGIAYKRQLDQSFRSTGVNPLVRRAGTVNGYRSYGVSTDDIDFDPSGGYFLSIRLRWRVQVGGHNYTKTVVCDRINTAGSRAYLCNNT